MRCSNAAQSSPSANTSRRLSRRYAVGATLTAVPARFTAIHSSCTRNTPFRRDASFVPASSARSLPSSKMSAASNTQP